MGSVDLTDWKLQDDHLILILENHPFNRILILCLTVCIELDCRKEALSILDEHK